MKPYDEFPAEHKCTSVHRHGAGVCGGIFLAFGCLGFADETRRICTQGTHITTMSTNGLRSQVSVAFGGILVRGAVLCGSLASTLSTVAGALFILSGWIHHSILTASTGGVVGVVRLARSFLDSAAITQGVRHGTQQ
ncbi:hypothetical protein [Streptomyces sp. NPDC003720]|uniref:hypothetical protein n=1 Tax=Streptomyces sp. NPDC003720 TaxID=3364684 RepID=UPI00368636D0